MTCRLYVVQGLYHKLETSIISGVETTKTPGVKCVSVINVIFFAQI